MGHNLYFFTRHFNQPKKLQKWVGVILSMLLFPTVSLQQRSTLAAERIYVSYAALEGSISVDSLETFAKEGKLEDDLDAYADRLNPQQLAQLQLVLVTPIDLGPVEVSQFLYTSFGETLLQRLGQIVQTEARQPGFYALRAALILAAADPEGLTLLNILRKFPTSGIRINLQRSLQVVEDIERLVTQTDRAIALIAQQSTATSNQPAIDFSQLPKITQPGSFTWNKQTISLYDRRRDRSFPADIYLPNIKAPAPVIVISHGLGSDRTSFVYLAQQLASYGFAVAVPEHPGSNADQLRALLAGRENEVVEPSEFINRPLDVKYLLDELQRIDAANPSIQLNLQQVGAIGQSFGGYTVLALAGASLNMKQLKTNCVNLNETLNASLLLQCRALELPQSQYNLRDPRIKAAIAINPVTSSIFGQAGLSQVKIPIMIVSSSADKVAPALAEQIQPFSWLTTPEKYLALLQGGTHFSTLGETNPATDPVPIPRQVIGPEPALARRYLRALSVAFLQTYIANEPQYRPYLSAAYAQAIGKDPINLNLVQSLPTTQLTKKSGSMRGAAQAP